jgi:hypothetical protein
VRLCQHQIVTWEMVIQAGLQLVKLNTANFATVLLNECQDMDHFPKHHQKHPFLTNRQTMHPTIYITGHRNWQISITLRWYGHLRLPDIGFDEEGYNKIATPDLVRRQLK